MTEIPGAGITTLSMHFPWFCIPTCPSSGMQHGQEPSAVTAERPVVTEGERRMSEEVTAEHSGTRGTENWPPAM